MTRAMAREIAVVLSFSLPVGCADPDEVVDCFFEPEHYASLTQENDLFSQRPGKELDYIRTLVRLSWEHRAETDAYIEKYARGWKLGRISRTAAAILRCAMCEILYLPEVPDAAAINEAVELAKHYEDADVVGFINGILGSFVRSEVCRAEE